MPYRCIVLVGLILVSTVAVADVEGKVTAVIDGDTIRVLDSGARLHKIRLTGIDAPERGQAFADASRKHLAMLVAGKVVRVESSKTDRYGRLLGKVRVRPVDCDSCDRTLDANLAQIQAGMAWWYYHYAREQAEQDRQSYKAAVERAQQQRIGLWSQAGAIPPWSWRRGVRSAVTAPAQTEFECGSKRYCREMSSCDEARYYLNQCGLGRLDGDRDGIPCESICR